MKSEKQKKHLEKLALSRKGIKLPNFSKNKHPMWGKKHSEDTIKKMKESHKGMTPHKGFKHSEETKDKQRKWTVKHPNKKFKDTSIEIKIEEKLKEKGIYYQKQIPLCNVAIVDFVLPNKMIIQCDGCYWHNCPIHFPNNHVTQSKKDKRQDKELELQGYKVIRLWEHDINRSIEDCFNIILNSYVK